MSAKQVIGVTLQTDGEKQFKQNISDCNKALKTMRSEMDLVKEKTAGQANSLDSLRQKHSVLEKTLDKYKEKQSEIRKGLVESEDTHNKLGKALEEHKKKLSDAEKELEKMKNSTSASNDEIEKQEKYVGHQQFLAIIQLIGTRKQAENCAYQRAQWSSAATDLGGPAAIYSRGRCNSRHEERLPSL